MRAGARSLRLAQRIISGFVQALDFAAVETLIPNLQPRAEGLGRSQVLDSEPDGFSSRCEPPVVFLCTLCRNSSAGAPVIERVVRHGALAKPLFVLKRFQGHRSERSSVAHATLREVDDLPGNETRCGIVYYLQAQRIAYAF